MFRSKSMISHCSPPLNRRSLQGLRISRNGGHLEVAMQRAPELEPPSPRAAKQRVNTMSYGDAPQEQLAEELASLVCGVPASGRLGKYRRFVDFGGRSKGVGAILDLFCIDFHVFWNGF